MMRVRCSIVLKKKTPLPASCFLFPNLSNGPFTNISDCQRNYSTVACYSPLWRSGDMLCCQMKNQRMSCLELLLSVLSASMAGCTKFLSHRWVIIHPCSEVFFRSKQRLWILFGGKYTPLLWIFSGCVSKQRLWTNPWWCGRWTGGSWRSTGDCCW